VAKKGHFTRKTFAFLRDLAENNNRDWFNANKGRYEEDVKGPALDFIQDFTAPLAKLSPHFKADPRTVGGSLFRIYRDTRFSKDKSPYKTYTGIQFRHGMGKDAHAPGFYLHLEPKQCFAGFGIWRPDGKTLKSIRESIVEDPKGWKKAISGAAFKRKLELSGDRLIRHPRGFDPDHPLIEDLKRKDFVGFAKLSQKAVTDPGFLKDYAAYCRAGLPLVAFLCNALDLQI
jgi:uncharacterized protein (TIGR02453 family)